jgi:hypothetical protein
MPGLLKPVDGLQEYDVPPDPLSVVFPPAQTVASVPALAVGNALTVTMTLSSSLQPLALVTVKVYVVVETGEATGLAMLGLLRPVVGDQL